MEDSTTKPPVKRRSLFSAVISDVQKTNAKLDSQQKLRLVGNDKESWNPNNMKESVYRHKPYSQSLNSSTRQSVLLQSLNSGKHYGSSKNFNIQSSNSRNYSEPRKNYDRQNSHYKTDFTSERPSKPSRIPDNDKPSSNYRHYSSGHNKPEGKTEKYNLSSRSHDLDLCKISNKHDSNYRLDSYNLYKTHDQFNSNSNPYSGKPHKNFHRHNSESSQSSELHGYSELSCRSKKQSPNEQTDNTQKTLPVCNLNIDNDWEDEKSENCIVLSNEINHQRIISESEDSILVVNMNKPNIKICLRNEVSAPKPVSEDNLSSHKFFSNLSDSINHNNTQILISSSEDFIPPPVICESINIPESPSTNSENVFSAQKITSETSYPDDDEAYYSLPDSEQLEAISDFIVEVTKKRSVPTAVAIRVVRDLTLLFKNHFEGNVIDVYGSYFSDLAITTSDINLFVKSNVSIRKSFMYEVYKVLSSELEKYHVHPFDEGISAHKSKINFIHPDSGVNCQLAYLGRYRENILAMGVFLKRMCLLDCRVKQLIIATKVWAEHLTINEFEEGKLHPVGFALLVIHYLQQCDNPILPIYSSNEEEREIHSSSNTSSIGELWMGFLRYYFVTFNWQQDIVTVNSKAYVSKKSKQWETYWIAIEDPFSSKNIAESIVNCDVADYIKSCFKSSYEYFSNPPDVIPFSSSIDENHSNAESSEAKFEFSFQNCMIEHNETYCEMCDEIGDICEGCKKKLYVPPMASVPKMTDSFLMIVKQVLELVYKKYILSDEEVNERKQFVKMLQDNVRRIYPDAQMNLFGSSANGFGFKNSDLDICMTFKTKNMGNTSAVLKQLRILLRNNNDFDHVIAIFNAQIPIIKFHYKPQKWRGDISLCNTLAVHNSELLYTYSLIDKRSRVLGCALKLLAKKALIAEVTEKALSSYSYLIMVIHFLQQVDPPVLPVLQDNKYRENNFELDDIVENYNVWFCKDISYIKEKFKTENETPVEQLFLDLLDYYCSIDCNQFITIRQKEIKFVGEKQQSARLFNIQDPFIEIKNLGRVVSVTKAQETKSVFNRARQLFRTPVKELPTGVKDIEDYFFSTMSLTGRIQKEVLCDLCGKFGHEQKECKHNFTLQRNNFYYRRILNRNTYANRNTSARKPNNQQPYWKKH